MWLSLFSVILLATMNFFIAFKTLGAEYTIYAVSQNVPMGHENEIIKKNYYLDFGTKQGAREGTLMEVYRIFSQHNPFDNNKQYSFKTSVGEIKIIHAEEYSSIAELVSLNKTILAPQLEIASIMIGDKTNIKLEKN